MGERGDQPGVQPQHRVQPRIGLRQPLDAPQRGQRVAAGQPVGGLGRPGRRVRRAPMAPGPSASSQRAGSGPAPGSASRAARSRPRARSMSPRDGGEVGAQRAGGHHGVRCRARVGGGRGGVGAALGVVELVAVPVDGGERGVGPGRGGGAVPAARLGERQRVAGGVCRRAAGRPRRAPARRHGRGSPAAATSRSPSTAIAAAPSSCSAATSSRPCSNSAAPWWNSVSARSASPSRPGSVPRSSVVDCSRALSEVAAARGRAAARAKPRRRRCRPSPTAGEPRLGAGARRRAPAAPTPPTPRAGVVARLLGGGDHGLGRRRRRASARSQWSATSARGAVRAPGGERVRHRLAPEPLAGEPVGRARVQLGLEAGVLEPQPGPQQLREQAVVAEPRAVAVERDDRTRRCARAARARARRRRPPVSASASPPQTRPAMLVRSSSSRVAGVWPASTSPVR